MGKDCCTCRNATEIPTAEQAQEMVKKAALNTKDAVANHDYAGTFKAVKEYDYGGKMSELKNYDYKGAVDQGVEDAKNYKYTEKATELWGTLKDVVLKTGEDRGTEDAPVEGTPEQSAASSARKEGGEEDSQDDGDFLKMSLDLQNQQRNTLDFDVAHAQHMQRIAAKNN